MLLKAMKVHIMLKFWFQLHPKFIAFGIKNKIKKLLTELRRFKFTATLVLVLKKKVKKKQNMTNFFHPHKQKKLLMKAKLMIMCLNQSILQLFQTF